MCKDPVDRASSLQYPEPQYQLGFVPSIRWLTHDFFTCNAPPIVLPTLFDLMDRLFMNAASEFQTRERHSSIGLFEGAKSTIHVQRDVITGLAYSHFCTIITLCNLDKKFLWMAVSKIKSRGFKHETLKNDNSFGMILENLLQVRRITSYRNEHLLTGSSGVSCSAVGSFIL